jgi:hypothetical protein
MIFSLAGRPGGAAMSRKHRDESAIRPSDFIDRIDQEM